MFKKLAILGHKTRNEEVIELLKMLGGRETFGLSCIYTDRFYYVSDEFIHWDYDDPSIVENKFEVFTLEKFLGKFPFKVGDFVRIPEYESEVRICKMKWTPFSDIEYLVYRNDDEEWYTVNELLEYNDNPIKTRDCKKCGLHFGSVRCFAIDCPHNKPKSYAVSLVGDKVIDNLTHKDIDMNTNTCKDTAREAHKKIAYLSINNEDYADQIEINLGDDYGYKFEKNRLYIVNKKPKYPKSYSDCCDILGFKNRNKSEQQFLNSCDLYDAELMTKFSMLKVCRDAYWKIAGEKLELGKPWKPDWNWENTTKLKYGIALYNDTITKMYLRNENAFLAFPTEEMRDAFYDNFSDLIECCKELL